MFDDDFQIDLLRSIHQADDAHRPDFFIYGNRLFNPDREFDGHRGVAFGGPDLSDRNLRVMTAFNREAGKETQLAWSATGNITTGKMAVEYALRGATSFQLHTFFQLPADQYRMKTGTRTQRALNELYFHPETGFVVWMEHLRQTGGLGPVIRLADIMN
jgi:dihydroorotate dehydrogenase